MAHQLHKNKHMKMAAFFATQGGRGNWPDPQQKQSHSAFKTMLFANTGKPKQRDADITVGNPCRLQAAMPSTGKGDWQHRGVFTATAPKTLICKKTS
jgi:hypothetical protein